MEDAKQLYMEYQALHSRLDHFLDELRLSLDDYEEMGLYAYDSEAAHLLKSHLIIASDCMRRTAGKLQRINELSSPGSTVPIIMDDDSISQVCQALDRARESLTAAAALLDEWPTVDSEQFCELLHRVRANLAEYSRKANRATFEDSYTIEPTNNNERNAASSSDIEDVCIDQNDVDLLSDLVEETDIFDDEEIKPFGNTESSKSTHRNALGFPKANSSDEETGFLGFCPGNAPIDAGLVYNTVLSRLRDVRFSLLICMDKCSYSTGSYTEAKQRFWDDRETIQTDAATVLECLKQLYSHSDDFLAWFASAYGEESLSRFDPSPASALLDAWNDVSELVDTLRKRIQRIGDELGLDDSETMDDVPIVTDNSSDDSFDLYAELDRKFAELYGGKNTSSDDDSDISPIFRRESFKDWLKRIIEGIEDLFQELMPATR